MPPLTMYLVPSRLSGRTNRRESSGSGIGENPRHFPQNLCFRPICMLGAQPGGLHFTRRPVKPFGQRKATFRAHAPVNGQLFGTRLLIRKHGSTVRRKTGAGKLFALAKTASVEWNGRGSPDAQILRVYLPLG